MTRLSSPKKALVMAVLLCAIGLGVIGSGTARADDALKMVPSGSLYCVRINNLDNALGRVDLFLTNLFPIGVSMAAKAQMGQILGSAQPQGLDTAGSFTLFGPLPGSGGPDPTKFGLLVPISDYQQFISGNENVSAADGMGISHIGPAGSPMMAATQVGKFALVGQVGAEQALADAKKSLTAGTTGLEAALDAAESKRATTAPVWAYGNVQAAAQLFGPMIQAKIQEIKQGMSAAEEQGASQMAAAGATIDMYATMIESVLNEGKYFSLSLDPGANQIGAALVVAGKANTGMAEMFQSAKTSPDTKLMGYLNSGAMMNFVGSLDTPFWEKYSELATKMMSQVMGASDAGAEMDEFKTMMAKAMDCYSGSIAGSFSTNPEGKPPFSVQFVAGLKDTEQFGELMDSVSEMMTSGAIAEFYEKMGMKVSFDLKRNVDTYKGASLDSVTFSLKATDADSPQAQMINSIYGDGFNVQLAAVDGKLVYALGAEPGVTVRKLIDQVKAGGSSEAPAEVKGAMQLISGADKADFFTTFNVLRFVKMIAAFAPMPIPASDIPTQSNLAIAGKTADGKMTVELGVPKQHVQEIMALVMQMQQQ